jgi:GNAT superfamily N-acetyltransferase
MREWFGLVAGLCFERGHTYIDERGRAAIAWVPPDVALVGPDEFARAVDILHRHAGPEHGEAAAQTILSARSHLLDESHWTLQYIGVRASARGSGFGREITRPMLEVCTREALPCVLISTNSVNVPFYRRLGFDVVAEVPTPDGQVALRPMVRPAASR